MDIILRNLSYDDDQNCYYYLNSHFLPTSQGRLSHAAEDVGSMKESLKSAQHKTKLAEEEVSTMRQALSEARDTISR